MFFALSEVRWPEKLDADDLTKAFLLYCVANLTRSHAQLFQDLFVDLVYDGAPGTFCEFGATDGVSLSNTYYLEAVRGWRGVLSEPSVRWQPALQANRPSTPKDFRCVFSATGERVDFNEVDTGELSGIAALTAKDFHAKSRLGGKVYTVETVTLNDMLAEHGIDRLDYLSVDTEGSELVILEKFDFARFNPGVLTVEHNFTETRGKLHALFTGHGYVRVLEQLSMFDGWYVRPDLLSEIHARLGISSR